jgi:hypothetical protein
MMDMVMEGDASSGVLGELSIVPPLHHCRSIFTYANQWTMLSPAMMKETTTMQDGRILTILSTPKSTSTSCRIRYSPGEEDGGPRRRSKRSQSIPINFEPLTEPDLP